MKRSVTDKLLQWKVANYRKPLIIKGMRQVGKTYSITEFGSTNFSKIHCFNFEKDNQLAKIFNLSLDPKRIISELSFHSKTDINITNDLVFFDEIQACPLALTSLKYFCEEMPQLALCAAGSLLGVYLNSTSFPVGKVNILEIFPLSFSEFLLATGEDQAAEYLNQFEKQNKISAIIHDRLWEQLKLYFVTGGLPEVVQTFVDAKDNLFSACKKVREKQNELITTYVADMAKHSGKVNAMHIDRVWHAVPAQLAREQDGAATKFQFKGIIPGITRYSRLVSVIDWLTAAGLVHKVPIVNHAELPLSAYTKENAFKLFMSDVGLLGALSNLSPEAILQYDYGTYKGYFAENFILQEFYSRGRKDIYCWQEGHAEVEFVCEIAGQIIPIEVKSGLTCHAKSLKSFVAKYRPSHSIILSGREFCLDSTSKVHNYPLYLAANI